MEIYVNLAEILRYKGINTIKMMADHMLSPASDVEKYLKCNGNKCKIEATVPTGFESVAADEAKEMFQCECSFVRGKIRFDTPVEKVKNVSFLFYLLILLFGRSLS